jgi:hypothetical protein
MEGGERRRKERIFLLLFFSEQGENLLALTPGEKDIVH